MKFAMSKIAVVFSPPVFAGASHHNWQAPKATAKKPRSSEFLGFSIVEVVIATLVLGIAAIASINLFSTYMVNSANARIRDGISSIIIKDIESMRYKASRLWICTSASTSSVCTTASAQGGLTEAYDPPVANCQAATLGTAAGTQDTSFSTSTPTSNLVIDSTTSAALRNPTISRTVTISGNVIILSYSTSNPIPVSHVAYIVPNAQAWCTL